MTLRRIALLLAAIVGTVILVYELRVHVFLADHSFPELIELTPANSTFIAYLDLAELRKEPLIGHLAALAEPVTVDPDYEQFISSTGFDYQRDLDQVVIATTADEKLAIADGRFDLEKDRRICVALRHHRKKRWAHSLRHKFEGAGAGYFADVSRSASYRPRRGRRFHRISYKSTRASGPGNAPKAFSCRRFACVCGLEDSRFANACRRPNGVVCSSSSAIVAGNRFGH